MPVFVRLHYGPVYMTELILTQINEFSHTINEFLKINDMSYAEILIIP